MQCNKSKRRLPHLARGFAALCAALAMAAAGSASAAPTETVLHSFRGGSSDGASPVAGVIAARAGNLDGTTYYGGSSGSVCGRSGCGVVFTLSPDGTETVLHSFTGLRFTGRRHGVHPVGSLIADSSGLYGTTQNGGVVDAGVVFKLSRYRVETVLHSFTFSDGAWPAAGLIADRAGNLYGTTFNGGAAGAGVVFKLAPRGTATLLHSFTGIDGVSPSAGLIADSSGNLYGTAFTGGASGHGGVVFKLSPDGTETVLYSFCSSRRCSDGAFPAAGLIADSSGNLYGTTYWGGASGSGCAGGLGCGVVFKLSPSGTETVLHSFAGSDGANPSAGLISDSSGNLYGTTYWGGASN